MRAEPLTQSHLVEAGELFAASYRGQRELVPILDPEHGTAKNAQLKLEKLLEKNPGVAVFDKDRMVGYMAGMYLDRFLSQHRGAYSPEWAHGSTDENAFEIYRLLYSEIARRWVADGCLTHAINFMDRASEAQNAFSWNGFGGICVDAMRPVGPIPLSPVEGLQVLPMQEDDIPDWLPMLEAQNLHLAGSPSFMPCLETDSIDDLCDMLKQPGAGAWMAWLDDEPVGYMKVAPAANGAAWSVNGERKFAVNGAYVLPQHRGKGLATAILACIMEWGASEGYVRCSVDFEATNPEACHLWLKHFQPVCRSMVRRLDERILKII
ncbi:MAG: GNAT family N-acetyltransferase [Thermoplasmata archaeon]|nr:GNAT family N-acetyltransferase [Thermoplasmata archaeon]